MTPRNADFTTRQVASKGTLETASGTDFNSFFSAYMAYRKDFPKIQEQEIKSFEKNYKGSETEKTDLLELFEKLKGDVTNILNFAILSTNDDISRIKQFYEGAIKSGKIKNHVETFNSTKDKIKKESDEKKEVDQLKSNQAELWQIISAKNSQRNEGFLEGLAKKYGGQAKDSKEKEAPKSSKKISKVN